MVFWGMSVADKGSYFSRFVGKLTEIAAAAVATAVSGYLVAHLSGYLPPQFNSFLPSRSAGPGTIQTAPNASTASKTAPSAPAQPAQAAAPPPAASVEATDQRALQSEVGAQPAKRTAKESAKEAAKESAKEAAKESAKEAAKESAKAAAARKRGKGDKTETAIATAPENKARDGEDPESVEARVRAALANVDANRPAPAAVLPAAIPPRPVDSSAGTPPRPLELPPNPTATTAPPRSADLAPPTVSAPPLSPAPPIQSTPSLPPPAPSGAQTVAVPPAATPASAAQPDAQTSVEIKSRPIATIDSTAPAPEQPAPPPEERGLFSAIKHILPDLRRPAGNTDEAPRPPAPVGEQ
jgi:hypothetical protein